MQPKQHTLKKQVDTMLLMDDNTLETDNPAMAFKKGKATRNENNTNILSEIAEEDDVSTISESNRGNNFTSQRISIGKSIKD